MSDVRVENAFWKRTAIVTNVIWMLGLVSALSIRAVRHSRGDYVSEPSSNPQYQDRMSLFEASVKRWSGTCDVLFLGDSHTQRGLFSEFYPDLRVVNRGIGSDTSDGALQRLLDVKKLSPRKLVVWIGGNDHAFGMSPDHVARNVERIVETVRLDSPATEMAIVGQIPREDEKPGDSKWREEVNDLLRGIACRNHVPYVPISAGFSEGGGNISKTKFISMGKGICRC